MRAVLLTLVLLLVTGCVAGNPTAANPQVANPAFSKAPFLFSAAVIDMRIDPKNAAEFILNPTPLGQDGYPLGMVVTIEVLPKEGWRVDDWAGPVFDVAGNVAKITMGSSHTVVARMKRTGPMATPTDTSIPPTASVVTKDDDTQRSTPLPTATTYPTSTPFSTSTSGSTSGAVFVYKWGTEGSGDGQFNGIRDSMSLLNLAVAPDGSVYVADYQNYRVQKFTSEGVFVTKWGTQGWGGGAFLQPLGVSVASDGSVYVADQSIGVQKFTSEGVFISDWDNRPTDEGVWHATSGVAVAPDGSVYIADGSNRIQKFTSDGGLNPCSRGDPGSMCEGVFVSQWGTEGSGDGQFDVLNSVAVAPDGSVYAADVNNQRIQKFTSEGVFVTKWGTFGDGDGQFWNPGGVTVASDGSVYVADTGNHRIQKFTSEGVFVTKWGTLGSGDGEFDHPRGVAVAFDGSVYVADPVNHRIQKFSVGQ